MKILSLILLALSAQVAAAADTPAFYVVDARSDDNIVVHTTSAHPPKADLPYAPFSVAKIDCCFRAGAKPGAHKAPPKPDEDSPLTVVDGDKKIHQFPGYLVTVGGAVKKSANTVSLAFGIEGMSAITRKGKDAYMVTFPNNAKPVYVRQCDGTEGVNIKLYHALSDKEPFAAYYFYMNYEMQSNCP